MVLMGKPLFTVQEFGENNSKVLFHFAGMGTRTRLYKGPIGRFVQNGYRVIAYDFDPLIVRNGDVQTFLKVGAEVSADVAKQVAALKTKGVQNFAAYGVSMGTLMAIKCAAEVSEIKKVVVNLTYGSVAENIWTWWFIRPAKKRAIEQGYNLKALDDALAPISPIPHATKLKGKRVLLYLAKRDKVLLYNQSQQFKEALDREGVDYDYVENKYFGHVISGFINYNRPQKYLSFLAK